MKSVDGCSDAVTDGCPERGSVGVGGMVAEGPGEEVLIGCNDGISDDRTEAVDGE